MREEMGSVRVDDLRDGETRSFAFVDALGLEDEAIVLRRSGDLAVFVNRCPHWKTALDAPGGDFYDRATDELVCHRHGARFDPCSGACTAGPAEGRLERLPFRQQGDRIVVEPESKEWID